MKLYPYQQQFVDQVASNPDRRFWLLGDGLGLGKTAQALVAGQAPTMLIVCPKATLGSWERECRTWLRQHPQLLTKAGDKPAADIVIVPWSMVSRLRHGLRKRNWGTLIIDEVHFAKNPDAQRTLAVLGKWFSNSRRPGLVDSAKRVFCLTGTPVPNRPNELRSVIGAMSLFHHSPFTLSARDRRKWGDRYCAGHMEDVYVRGGGRRRVYNDSGASRLTELSNQLYQHGMVRRTKAEVLTELPPVRKHVMPLLGSDLPPYPLAWGEALRGSLSGKCALPSFEDTSAYRLALGKAKVPGVADCAIEFCAEDPDSGLLVFAHHQAVAEGICSCLVQAGVSTVCIHGGTNATARAGRMAAFADGRAQVLVATLGTMGTGVDGLQKRADTCLVAELPWVPAELDQAIGRLHRIGQTGSVLARILVASPSMDDHIIDILLEKESVTECILSSRKPEEEERKVDHDGDNRETDGAGDEGRGGGRADGRSQGADVRNPRRRQRGRLSRSQRERVICCA